MKSELSTGEWQVDPRTGRRFRKIGNYGVEWEGDLLTAHGFMSESELEQFNARPQQAEPIGRPEKHTCPFRAGMQTDCTGEQCALYASDGCSLAALGDNATNDTAGKSCPLNGFKSVCRSSCVFYKNGCIFTGIKPEREDI